MDIGAVLAAISTVGQFKILNVSKDICWPSNTAVLIFVVGRLKGRFIERMKHAEEKQKGSSTN